MFYNQCCRPFTGVLVRLGRPAADLHSIHSLGVELEVDNEYRLSSRPFPEASRIWQLYLVYGDQVSHRVWQFWKWQLYLSSTWRCREQPAYLPCVHNFQPRLARERIEMDSERRRAKDRILPHQTEVLIRMLLFCCRCLPVQSNVQIWDLSCALRI